MRSIRLISVKEKEIARKMLNDYLIELSVFDDNIKFDDKGVPIYKWYDPYYFIDKDRYAFFLIVDGMCAGLCFIRQIKDNEFDIAEFYVKPSYRKDGNALFFASEVTSLFNGNITFSTRHKNLRGIKFWSKFALLFENSSYTDDEVWRNFIVYKKW